LTSRTAPWDKSTFFFVLGRWPRTKKKVDLPSGAVPEVKTGQKNPENRLPWTEITIYKVLSFDITGGLPLLACPCPDLGFDMRGEE